jgi:hypothetical protein
MLLLVVTTASTANCSRGVNVRVHSAKDRTGVKQAFDEVAQKILDTPDLWNKSSKSKTLLGAAVQTPSVCGALTRACAHILQVVQSG